MHLPTCQDGVENRHKVYSEKRQCLETLMAKIEEMVTMARRQ